MNTSSDSSGSTSTLPPGVRYARWAGHALGIFLIFMALKDLCSGSSIGTFEHFKNAYFILYGLLLNLPYDSIGEAYWKIAYGIVSMLSALFVFLMIAVVMFAYMAAAEQGERLGVPGFEGSLIFIALMQVPVILFQRRPDLID